MPRATAITLFIDKNSREIRLTRLVLLITTAIALIVWTQNYYKNIANDEFSLKLSLIYNLIVYGSFALFTPVLLKLSVWFPLLKNKWFYAVHLLVSIALVMGHMVICNLILFSVDLSSVPILDRFVAKYLTNVVHIHLLTYWSLLLVLTYYLKPHKEEAKTKEELLDQFEVRENGRVLFIQFEQVLWIEALDHYQKLHTSNGYHLIKDTMHHLESVLPFNVFFRAHRSYIVNRSHVKSIFNDPSGSRVKFLELDNGTRLRLGNSYRNKINQQ